MIEVFKTNVQHKWQAAQLLEVLYEYFPGCKINFDMDDCDKVLRMEGINIIPESVKIIVNKKGFMCDVLE